jgi:hypothetical protein
VRRLSGVCIVFSGVSGAVYASHLSRTVQDYLCVNILL